MGKLAVLKAREVCRILETLGFALVRQRGEVKNPRKVPSKPEGKDERPTDGDGSVFLDVFVRDMQPLSCTPFLHSRLTGPRSTDSTTGTTGLSGTTPATRNSSASPSRRNGVETIPERTRRAASDS